MDNNEIRKTILQSLYDDYYSNGYVGLTNSSSLPDKVGVDKTLVGANLRYLFEKRMIEGTPVPNGSGFGYFKITSFGIDAIENPEKYSGMFPFLQIIARDIVSYKLAIRYNYQEKRQQVSNNLLIYLIFNRHCLI